MTIKEVLSMAGDMPVLDLVVTVAKVMERRTGDGQYGPWSFQDLNVTDDTGEIWVKAQGKDDLSAFKGQKVRLSCFKSDKHGWVGLKTFDDEYQGTVRRKLAMTKTGVIEPIGNAPREAPQTAVHGPSAKDGSICRQVAGKVVAELWRGTGKTFEQLISEATLWENYFLYGLPPEEKTETHSWEELAPENDPFG